MKTSFLFAITGFPANTAAATRSLFSSDEDPILPDAYLGLSQLIQDETLEKMAKVIPGIADGVVPVRVKVKGIENMKPIKANELRIKGDLYYDLQRLELKAWFNGTFNIKVHFGEIEMWLDLA